MHEVVRRSRQHAVRRERAFARAQEPLNPLPADPIVVHVTKQPDPIEGTEHVPFLESAMLPVVLLEEAFHLSSSQNMSREPPEEALEIQVTKVWRDLGQVLVCDLGGGLVHHFLEAMLLPSLLWPESGQTLPNGHEIARPE